MRKRPRSPPLTFLFGSRGVRRVSAVWDWTTSTCAVCVCSHGGGIHISEIACALAAAAARGRGRRRGRRRRRGGRGSHATGSFACCAARIRLPPRPQRGRDPAADGRERSCGIAGRERSGCGPRAPEAGAPEVRGCSWCVAGMRLAGHVLRRLRLLLLAHLRAQSRWRSSSARRSRGGTSCRCRRRRSWRCCRRRTARCECACFLCEAVTPTRAA